MKSFGLSSRLILEEAKRRRIKISVVEPKKVALLEYKGHIEVLFQQFISKTTAVATGICNSKDTTRSFLQKANISIPMGSSFESSRIEEGLAFLKQMKKPVVLKPSNATHGTKVFLGIKDEAGFKAAWQSIRKKYQRIVLEEEFKGLEYRILSSKDKVLAVTHRVPANVVGDGTSTIKELIQLKNRDPKRGNDYRSSLLKIKIDKSLKDNLSEQGLTLESIPKKDETIFLRKTSNLSTGGDSIDYTDKVHPSVKKIAVQAINAIPGLAYAGIDFMTKDVTKKQTKDSYIIIEINGSPMISMHHVPHEGKSRDVAKEIINIAFPETKQALAK